MILVLLWRMFWIIVHSLLFKVKCSRTSANQYHNPAIDFERKMKLGHTKEYTSWIKEAKQSAQLSTVSYLPYTSSSVRAWSTLTAVCPEDTDPSSASGTAALYTLCFVMSILLVKKDKIEQVVVLQLAGKSKRLSLLFFLFSFTYFCSHRQFYQWGCKGHLNTLNTSSLNTLN